MIFVRRIFSGKVWLCFLLACLMLLPAGCRETADTPDVSPDEMESDMPSREQQRFVYLCEDMSLLKYQDIAAGIRERCEERSIACTMVDARGRMEVVMTYIDEINERSADVMMVSLITEPVGPLIQNKCDAANIPMFSVSSRLRDETGQESPGIEISAFESGAAVASCMADAIQKEKALDIRNPITVVVCNMSNITCATAVRNGFCETFFEYFPDLSSDSYVELEVLSPDAEGQYFSLTNYFGKPSPDMQYVLVTFNDDGVDAIVRYVQEAELPPENLLIGSVGLQANGKRVFGELPEIAARHYAVSVDYHSMGRQAVDEACAALELKEDLPLVFLPLGEVITADKYQQFTTEGKG